MTRVQLCLFCDNLADSKEDVIPVWIQEKVKGKRPIVVNGFAGDRAIVMQGMRSNLKTTCVCGECNGGWRSRLEGAARKILGPLMEDIHLRLDGEQQYTITKWAVKTAMTAETFNRKTRKLFYTRDECAHLRESWTFPTLTLVCLGRYAGDDMHVGVFGSEGWDNDPESPNAMHSYTTTLVFGRVAIQIVVIHVGDNLQRIDLRMRPGPWGKSLLELRPLGKILFWPPRLSFSDRGPNSLQSLVERFKIDPDK